MGAMGPPSSVAGQRGDGGLSAGAAADLTTGVRQAGRGTMMVGVSEATTLESVARLYREFMKGAFSPGCVARTGPVSAW